MQRLVLLPSLICLAAISTAAPADESPDYISDAKIQSLFVKAMSKLLEEEKTGDPDLVQAVEERVRLLSTPLL